MSMAVCSLYTRSAAVPVCEHVRVRSVCKECGGSSICEHGRVRSLDVPANSKLYNSVLAINGFYFIRPDMCIYLVITRSGMCYPNGAR